MRYRDRLRRLERLAPAAEALGAVSAPLEVRRAALAELAAWQHAQQAAGADIPAGLPALCMRRLGLAGEV